MNKIFYYKTLSFNIKIELNVTIERSPEGKHYHKVTVNDLGQTNQYYKTFTITIKNDVDEKTEAEIIKDTIEHAVEDVKNTIDGKTQLSHIDSVLNELGFE